MVCFLGRNKVVKKGKGMKYENINDLVEWNVVKMWKDVGCC